MAKLAEFLELVRRMDFRAGQVPKVWNSEYREALSSGLLEIHFAGSIRLSEKGHEHLKNQ
jgi:hypothetical protein